jgi:hypothetical protein
MQTLQISVSGNAALAAAEYAAQLLQRALEVGHGLQRALQGVYGTPAGPGQHLTYYHTAMRMSKHLLAPSPPAPAPTHPP